MSLSVFPFRFTYTKAYKNLLNELGDQAGQHEVIAENLSTQVVHELNTLVKQLKDDRRKVRDQKSNARQIRRMVHTYFCHHAFNFNRGGRGRKRILPAVGYRIKS